MTTARAMTIWAPEPESLAALSKLPDGKHFQLVKQASSNQLKHTDDLFVSVSATALSTVSRTVKLANETKLLRVLFIREDLPGVWLPQMLSRAELRMARNILVHTAQDWDTPRRIIRAWQHGSQHDLIARASVNNNLLLLTNCALESFQVAFDSIPALKKIPVRQRTNFRLSESGSYIHWAAGDVHLDLDAVRYATDDNWRKKCDLETLTHNKNFGQAIASVRKTQKIDQASITGLSSRQLRRIEKEGTRPSVATLTVLAKAHKLSLNDYLEKLAEHLAKKS